LAKWVVSDDIGACSSSDAVILSRSTAIDPFSTGVFTVSSVSHSIDQRGLTNARAVLSAQDPLQILTLHYGGPTSDTIPYRGDLQKGSAFVADWKVMDHGGPATDLALNVIGDNLSPLFRSGCALAARGPVSTSAADNGSPLVAIESSGSVNGSACNAREYTITVRDNESGIDHLDWNGSNFKVTADEFIPGTDSIVILASVVNPKVDGAATITVFDRAQHVTSRNLTYCSVQDLLPPVVRIDTARDSAVITILERREWDRGILGFNVTHRDNAAIDSTTMYQSVDSMRFVVRVIDASRAATFCLTATDFANNTSNELCWLRETKGVADERETQIILLAPNPAANALTLSVPTPATLEILSVLGATVYHGDVEGSQTIDIRSLAAGSYIARIRTGDSTISRRFVVRR
jgi:hypothetical protein